MVRDTCLCLHLQRAARAVARQFDEALRPLGLTNGQFSLLMSLNRPEPPTIGNVAALLAMDRTTLTANLKPLERRGLVEVRIDSADRRSRRLILTRPAAICWRKRCRYGRASTGLSRSAGRLRCGRAARRVAGAFLTLPDCSTAKACTPMRGRKSASRYDPAAPGRHWFPEALSRS